MTTKQNGPAQTTQDIRNHFYHTVERMIHELQKINEEGTMPVSLKTFNMIKLRMLDEYLEEFRYFVSTGNTIDADGLMPSLKNIIHFER